MKKVFFILTGNNGATYIFNVKNWTAITQSLKFYKARSLKQNILKSGLHVGLFFLGLSGKIIQWSFLRNNAEIVNHINTVSDHKIPIELDNNCSILISPTKDKIIVHHHNAYFHKYAFGNSLNKVKNEIAIYKLLDKPLIHFQVAKIYDTYQTADLCSFKLKNTEITKKYDLDLVSALVEFFNAVPTKNCLLSDYIFLLENRCSVLEFDNPVLLQDFFEKLKNNYADLIIPLGLVHRDFKPWNISYKNHLLIYDFEEAITNGLPLEDLFNYIIDPAIANKSIKKTIEMILKSNDLKFYQIYLKKLKLNIDFQILLNFFFLEKAIFWKNNNKEDSSHIYCQLFEYFN